MINLIEATATALVQFPHAQLLTRRFVGQAIVAEAPLLYLIDLALNILQNCNEAFASTWTLFRRARKTALRFFFTSHPQLVLVVHCNLAFEHGVKTFARFVNPLFHQVDDEVHVFVVAHRAKIACLLQLLK